MVCSGFIRLTGFNSCTGFRDLDSGICSVDRFSFRCLGSLGCRF